MLKNKDGMRYPSIDKLLEKIDSKYKLVYAASKVARIIEDEKLVVENAQCVKSIGMALEEILNDKVQVDFET
jgi:DNA-directed RNA polymerase subunit omega